MNEELKTNIAKYVEVVGEKRATITAFKKLKELGCFYETNTEMAIDISDFLVGSLKFQTGVIEYLHCADGEPDKFCDAISKNKICY